MFARRHGTARRAGQSPEPRERVFVLALAAVALAVRLLHVLAMRASPLFAADRPPSDAHYYDKVAWAVASGDLSGGAEAAYLSSPPYVAFLAGIYAVAGHDVLVPRLVQAALGTGTAVLLYFIARRLFGRVAAGVAGVLAALYGLFVFYDGELLKASLGLFALCLSLFLLVRRRGPLSFLARALKTGPLADARGSDVAAGLALGIAVLTMGSLALFTAAAVAWAAVPSLRAGRRALAPAASLVLGASLVLVPFELRGSLLPPDKQVFLPLGGVHAYIGNNPDAKGTYTRIPGIRPSAEGHVVDATKLASEAAGHKLSPAEVSRYFRGRALAFATDEPIAFLTLCARKVRLFFNAYEVPNNEDPYLAQRTSWILAAPLFGFWLVCPLGLAGALLGFRGRRGVGLVFALFATSLFAVFGAFVTARYRLPAVPALILFAARFVAWARARVLRLVRARGSVRDTRGGRALSALVAPALFFGVIVNLPTPLSRDQYMASARQGEAAAARPLVTDRCERRCAALVQNAMSLAARGRRDEAIETLEEARREAPDSPEVLTRLAKLLEAQGRYAEAAEILRAMAKRRNPP